MKEDRLYYKKRLYRSELVTETSWADRFMLKSSGLKLPCLLVYGETVMKSRASAGGFDQQGYSFNLVTGGEGVFHIGGRHIPVRTGDLCIGSYLSRHSFSVPPGRHMTKSYVSVYYNLLLTELDGSLRVIPRCGELFAPLFLRIRKLLSESGEEGMDNFQGSALAYELIYRVLTLRQTEKNAGEDEFKQFLHRLTGNLKRKYTLASMAEEFGCSIPTLIRLFRKYTGLPPMGFLKKVRLEYAAYLLQHPDSSIRSTMLCCGYKDQSFFTREFRRFFRISPLAYRKRNVSPAMFENSDTLP